MDIKKYLALARKAMLATLSFWGYYFVRTLAYGVVKVFFYNEDTEIFGYPELYFSLSAVLSLIVIVPYCLDSLSCDTVAKNAYIASCAEKQGFSAGNEFKRMLKEPEFIVYTAISFVWFYGIFEWYHAIIALAVNVFGELFVRISHYAEATASEEIKPDKTNPFVKHIVHLLLWFGGAAVIILITFVLRELFSSVSEVVKDFFAIAFTVLVSVCVLLYIYRRLRAIRIQRKLFKKLVRVCRDNGIRFKAPKGIYSSLLKQKVMYLTLERNDFRFNCLLVPTLLRKTPLYLMGNGEIRRVHNFYLFKIEMFSSEKIIKYQLPKAQKGEKNIILLSPIPREFYIGAPGNAAPGDFNSEVDKALVYSGSEFCNYVERVMSEHHIYKKEEISH